MIVNEDYIKYEMGIIKIQIFIDVVMMIVLLLSSYVAFETVLTHYNNPGIEAILSKVIIVLIFVLIGLFNCMIGQVYQLIKNLKAYSKELNLS